MAMAMKRNLFGDSSSAGGNEDGENQCVDPVKKMRCVENRRKEKGLPIACHCGVAVAVATCNSSNRRGERFFCCGKALGDDAGEGCDFKRWVEEAMLEEFAKVNEEKEELQTMLDAANKRIDEDQGRLVWMQVQYEDMMADRKQVEDYSGELCDTQLGIAEVKDRQNALEKKVEMLEKRYERERVLVKRYGDVRSKDKGVPRKCDCGHGVVVQTESEPLNRGRKYFSCPYVSCGGPVRGCGFKRWWTQAILEEFELIREEQAAMEKSLEEAKEKHEGLENRVTAGEDDGMLELKVIEANRKLAELTENYADLARKYEWLESKYLKLNMYL